MKIDGAFRPIGIISGGLTIPMTIVISVVLLLFLLRYVSVRLITSDRDSIKEVPMVKTLKARTLIFLSSVIECLWAAGVGIVAGHLST